MRTSEDKLHRQLVDFIREATGLSSKTINAVIGLYNLFICSELSQGKTMSLKGLLSLIPYKGKRPQIRTILKGPLQKALYSSQSQQGKKTNTLRNDLVELPKPVSRYLDPDTDEERAILDEIAKYAVFNGIDINEDVNLNKILIRRSLLGYLAHDFIYGQHWVHPLSNETYSRKEIAKSLLYLRNADPELYALVYGMWLGSENRKRLYKKLELDRKEVIEKVNRAVDSLVMCITHPGFVPSYMKNLLSLQGDWNQTSEDIELSKNGSRMSYRGVR